MPKYRSIIFRQNGFSIVMVLVSIALSFVLLGVVIEINRMQNSSIKGFKLTMERDRVVDNLARIASNKTLMERALTQTANAEFLRCSTGSGATTHCTGNSDLPVNLVNAADQIITGNSRGSSVYYSQEGTLCDGATVATAQCPYAVWTTFKALCLGGTETCAKAATVSIKINVEAVFSYAGIGSKKLGSTEVIVGNLSPPIVCMVFGPAFNTPKFGTSGGWEYFYPTVTKTSLITGDLEITMNITSCCSMAYNYLPRSFTCSMTALRSAAGCAFTYAGSENNYPVTLRLLPGDVLEWTSPSEPTPHTMTVTSTTGC